jgi:hypothetical protein
MRLFDSRDNWAGGIGEARSAVAAGGLACSVTAARAVFPHGTSHVRLFPRNFSTATLVKFGLMPYLAAFFTNDGLATVTNISRSAQDGSTATTIDLSGLKTLANGGAIYLGCPWMIRGLDIDVQTTNSNAATLAAHYWKGSWTSLSPTDGTFVTTATLAQDGLVTWTVPTDATKDAISSILGAVPLPFGNESLYWFRLSVSAALDATVTLNSMLGLPRSTVYAELLSGMAQEFRTEVALYGHAGVEALTDAGTANLVVDCWTDPGNAFE